MKYYALAQRLQKYPPQAADHGAGRVGRPVDVAELVAAVSLHATRIVTVRAQRVKLPGEPDYFSGGLLPGRYGLTAR
jgi:hypothetical protein